MAKLGRNDPCWCGSGVKFKRCHGALDGGKPPARQLPAGALHVLAKFARERLEREKFAERHGEIIRPSHAFVGDSRYVVAGGAIYKQDGAPHRKFVNFIHDYALITLTEEWLDAEDAKPEDQRHQVVRWMTTFVEHNNGWKARLGPNGAFPPIGAGPAWFRFAYDLYLIRNNAKLEKRLLERLRDNKSFQGARYELAVAATFLCAGFDLRFEDETDNRTQHPEFIAVDRKTGLRIAVEAKSRRYQGVYDFRDGRPWSPEDGSDVRGVLAQALRKRTGLPYYICVDVNLPPAGKTPLNETGWPAQLGATFEDMERHAFGPENFPANGVLFTNDPSHHILTDHLDIRGAALWQLWRSAASPRVPHPEPDVSERICRGYFQRSTVPEEWPPQ